MGSNHERIISILYPRRCPVCDRVVPRIGDYICPPCKDKIKYISGVTCLKCGKPMQNYEQEYCKDCLSGNHYFTKGAALCNYQSIRQSVYRIKYEGRREYLDFYGKQIADCLGEQIRIWNPDALLAIPLHPKRQKVRGYNQAEILAKRIGEEMKIPVCRGLVKRRLNTIPQKGLDTVQRQNNLKKAFIISENVVKLSTIIIIDDIYTTGSTIDAVAKLLLDSGVSKVYFVTLAIGE